MSFLRYDTSFRCYHMCVVTSVAVWYSLVYYFFHFYCENLETTIKTFDWFPKRFDVQFLASLVDLGNWHNRQLDSPGFSFLLLISGIWDRLNNLFTKNFPFTQSIVTYMLFLHPIETGRFRENMTALIWSSFPSIIIIKASRICAVHAITLCTQFALRIKLHVILRRENRNETGYVCLRTHINI